MDESVHKAAVERLRGIIAERFQAQVLDARSIGFDWVAQVLPASCYVEINPDANGIVMRVIIQFPVRPENRSAVAELIHRINYDQPIGCWAIDLESGDLRFKSGFYFGSGDITDELMKQLIESSLFFVEHDIHAFIRVQSGGSVQESLSARGTTC